MRSLILVTVLAGGCTTDSVAWDRAIRPVAAPGSSPVFAARVENAVFIWQRALGCADVMSGVAGTGPVYEVTASDFSYRDLGPTVSGETWDDKVWISSVRPEMEDEILVHELGHVLGLEHVTLTEDPRSVMHANDDGILLPDAGDVERVGCR